MDLSKLKTVSIKKRKSKVNKALFAKTLPRGASFKDFFKSLPQILKAKELRDVVEAVALARAKKKPVLFLMGAHVIKCGLSPLIIDLIKKDIITSVSLNGAGIIHDFEIAYCASTSEDVACALEDGSFGMVRETADFINGAVREGLRLGLGFGASVGLKIAKEKLEHRDLSIACACVEKGIPLTVHVAIGTDIIHQHLSFSGSDTGEASLRDFRRLTQEVAGLTDGGVLINIGSAVLLPEVFLKALSVARNLTKNVKNFTTVNFDMNFHYRPYQNIVTRPVLKSGRGFYILGHHEIMLPLLALALKERMGR